MANKWWEKTVEYTFVLRHMSQDSSITPLDGREELGGDAIFSASEKLLLIEFKRSCRELDSEESKFSNYAVAKKALEQRDLHHLLIYGELQHDNALSLKACTYFRREEVLLDRKLSLGTSLVEFKRYLQELLKYKTANTENTGSTGGLVMGVDNAGKVIGVISANDFVASYDLESKARTSLGSTPPKRGKGPSP